MSVDVVSWNSQGIKVGTIDTLIKKRAPDVLLLQESGDLDPNTPFGNYNTWQWNFQYRCTFLPWARSINGNPRSSMAILYNSNFGGARINWSNDNMKRPIMSVYDNASRLRITNIHAGGINYITEAINIAQRDHRWIVAGDFNQDPARIEHDYPDQVVEPGQYTRGARTLDFAVSNIEGQAQTLNYKSDHYAVQFDFRW